MLTPSIRWRGRAATRAALERWLAAHPIDAPPGLTTVLHVLTRETLPAPAAHSVVFDNAHAPPLFGLDDPERLDRDDGRRRPSAALERRFAAWRAAGRPNALRVLARYPERAADVDWLMSEGWQLDELAGVLYRLPPRQVTALFARHPTRLREAARRLLLPAALLRRMASPERIAQRALQRLRSEMTYQRWSDWEVWACMGWFRPAWPPTSRLAPVFETLVRTPALDALVGELLGADDLPELIRRDLALRWARARPGAAARFAAGRLGWDVARVILAQLVWQPRGGLGLLREAALDAHWRVAYLGLAGLASRGAVPASPPRCRDPLVDLAWLTARPDRSQDCLRTAAAAIGSDDLLLQVDALKVLADRAPRAHFDLLRERLSAPHRVVEGGRTPSAMAAAYAVARRGGPPAIEALIEACLVADVAAHSSIAQHLSVLVEREEGVECDWPSTLRHERLALAPSWMETWAPDWPDPPGAGRRSRPLVDADVGRG